MPADIEAERKTFEQWLRDLGYNNRCMKRSKYGAYASGMFNECFEGWKARASIRREVIAWRYINPDGIAYKWNEGAPTEDDRKNVGIGDHIQVAYSE